MLRILGLVSILSMSAACGGDDDGGGGGADAAAGAATCAAYCDAIMTNCTDVNAQYGSMQNCLDSCAAYDQGTVGTMEGNSLECRTYHAGAAATTPGVHCVHAGPGGAGQCGDNCEGFCSIALDACDGTFDDEADCMTTCAAFDDSEPFDASDMGGDTLACRLYHVTAAATAPDPHCMHIDTVSSTCN